MSDSDRCMRRARWGIFWIIFWSIAMGFFVMARSYADVDADIHDIRISLEAIKAGWWRELLPGGVVVAGLISGLATLWKALQRSEKARTEQAIAMTTERITFAQKLETVVKTGEASQEQRREAVDILIREMREQTQVLKDFMDEKKKEEGHSGESALRAGVRKR